MKVATTIQISTEEDREIMHLKKELGLATKKAVIMEGVHSLAERVEEWKRKRRLQKASQLTRRESIEENRLWAPLAAPLKAK